MLVIGIHNTGYFSSCSIFKDNSLVFASAEERLSRIKFDNQFPFNAIDKGLKKIGATYDDVDEYIIAWNPYINASSRYRAGFSRWTAHPMQRLYSNINAILPRIEDKEIDVSSQIIKYKNKEVKFTFVNHHFAHIGMVYNTSGFDNSAIFIADGYGEETSTLLAVNENDKLRILKEHKFPHSLGMFYAAMTEFIEFNPEQDEWKVMGASAYGDENKYYNQINKLIHVSEGDLELDLNYFNFYNFDTQGYFSNKMIELLGEPCNYEENEQKVYDIAAATQKVFEEKALELLTWLNTQYPSITNLCYGGGTAMNGLLNGKIKKLTPYENLHISFAPDDIGNSIGSVLYHHNIKLPNLQSYLGLEYNNDEIETILSKFKIKANYFEDEELFDVVSNALIDESIVAWFQGKMEFGQRALGNRSILANPEKASMKDKLNSAIKYREPFRPFAPSILEEKADEYFEDYIESPYMEKILTVKEVYRDKVAAIVHGDFTGRLQTVSKNTNNKYYSLIKAFYEKTGIPLLVNTSFNVAGEPVVCSPEDAVKTFFTSGLDILVLGNYVIRKDNSDT
ncbi:MAG: carbamoyltransferase [Halarcobacter sp.]